MLGPTKSVSECTVNFQRYHPAITTALIFDFFQNARADVPDKALPLTALLIVCGIARIESESSTTEGDELNEGIRHGLAHCSFNIIDIVALDVAVEAIVPAHAIVHIVSWHVMTEAHLEASALVIGETTVDAEERVLDLRVAHLY